MKYTHKYFIVSKQSPWTQTNRILWLKAFLEWNIQSEVCNICKICHFTPGFGLNSEQKAKSCLSIQMRLTTVC